VFGGFVFEVVLEVFLDGGAVAVKVDRDGREVEVVEKADDYAGEGLGV